MNVNGNVSTSVLLPLKISFTVCLIGSRIDIALNRFHAQSNILIAYQLANLYNRVCLIGNIAHGHIQLQGHTAVWSS